VGSGLTATNYPVDENSELRLTQLTIHDSNYGKINAHNIPVTVYEAQVSLIHFAPFISETTIVSSLQLSIGFIPDIFYIQFRVPYAHQHSGLSNTLG